MLHLRRAGLLDTTAQTVTGETLDDVPRLVGGQPAPPRSCAEQSARAGRHRPRRRHHVARRRPRPRPHLHRLLPRRQPRARRLASSRAPPSIPSLIDADGVYRQRGPARVFTTEAAAIAAIKTGAIRAGDVLVLICRGPAGAGMEEIYQITSALKPLPSLQARRRAHRRPLQRRLHRRLHRPHLPRSARRRPHRQACATAT